MALPSGRVVPVPFAQAQALQRQGVVRPAAPQPLAAPAGSPAGGRPGFVQNPDGSWRRQTAAPAPAGAPAPGASPGGPTPLTAYNNPAGGFANYGLQGGTQRSLDLRNLAQGMGQPDERMRASQMQNVAQLQQQAAGQGPSMATQGALEQSRRNVAAQQALAAGAAPGMQAAALRQAMQNASSAGASIGGQAAAGRAQEQLGAMDQLGQQLTAYRGQDLQGQNQASQAQLQALQQELQNAELMQRGGLALEGDRQKEFASMLGAPEGTSDAERNRGLVSGVLSSIF